MECFLENLDEFGMVLASGRTHIILLGKQSNDIPLWWLLYLYVPLYPNFFMLLNRLNDNFALSGLVFDVSAIIIQL